jgi:hypothetical protein
VIATTPRSPLFPNPVLFLFLRPAGVEEKEQEQD